MRYRICLNRNRKTECSEHSAYTIGLDGVSLQVNDGQNPPLALTLGWVFYFLL